MASVSLWYVSSTYQGGVDWVVVVSTGFYEPNGMRVSIIRWCILRRAFPLISALPEMTFRPSLQVMTSSESSWFQFPKPVFSERSRDCCGPPAFALFCCCCKWSHSLFLAALQCPESIGSTLLYGILYVSTPCGSSCWSCN